MTKFKIGSLFDGSGGFPLAASMCGIEPTWASEVEPYPIAVTRSRFPNMKHLGSVTDINGAEIEPVDIITFGSPCQDLSVAGKRAGLKHEANGDDETTRSGLFMEAVRIIREMREATNGRYPTFALWENVPGAFSSNKGEDFRTVCEELIKIVEPGAVMPAVPQKGWPYADSYCGDGWSLAYRVFDAQFWGVPQRRRRIHLVLDLRGERAGKVLFEREGLRGYSAESGTEGQGTTGNVEDCAGAADRADGGLVEFQPVGFDTYNMQPTGDKTVTLRAGSEYNYAPVFQPVVIGLDIYNLAETGDIAASLTTATGQGASNTGPSVCVKTYDARGNGDGETVSTITGDHENRITDYSSVVVEEQSVYCLQGNGIDRADTAGCNGKGWKEDVSYMLNTIDRPAVAYGIETFHCNTEEEKVPTLKARDWKDPNVVVYAEAVAVRYIVRRLTPTECARLQGFPDTWGHPDRKEDFTDEEYSFWLEVRNTHAAINGKAVKEYTKDQMLKWYNGLHTDSAEYKMWGNGIALPPALYCMQGMAEALEAEQ